jgi:hypothetical protein
MQFFVRYLFHNISSALLCTLKMTNFISNCKSTSSLFLTCVVNVNKCSPMSCVGVLRIDVLSVEGFGVLSVDIFWVGSRLGSARVSVSV